MNGSCIVFIFPDGVLKSLAKKHPKRWHEKGMEGVWEIYLTKKGGKHQDWATIIDRGSTAEISYSIGDAGHWQKFSNNAPEITRIREIINKIKAYHKKK